MGFSAPGLDFALLAVRKTLYVTTSHQIASSTLLWHDDTLRTIERLL